MTTLDLERLVEAHPKLSLVRAAELAECAALALEARGHEPGIELAIEFLEDRNAARVAWTRRGPATLRCATPIGSPRTAPTVSRSR